MRRCGSRSTSWRRRPAPSRSCPGSSTSSCSIRPTVAGSRRPASRPASSPSHLGTDAEQARRLWGARAEASGYAWGSLAATGAVLAFGTDAPVEPFDPWPGIALAVRREDPRWPAGTPPFAPGRGAHRRARAARRVRRPTTLGAATGTAAGSSSASTPTWWSSRRRRWPSRSNRAAPSPRRAHRWSSSTAGSPTRPDLAGARNGVRARHDHPERRPRRNDPRAKAFPRWFRANGTNRRSASCWIPLLPTLRPRRGVAAYDRPAASRSFRFAWNHLEVHRCATVSARLAAPAPGPRGLAGTPRVELLERVGEQAVEDPRRRRERVDRLGEDVDRDPGLDRQHAFVDRRRGVRAGHRGADELA